MRKLMLSCVCFALAASSCKQRTTSSSTAKGADNTAAQQKMEAQQKEFNEDERQKIMSKFNSGAFSQQIAQLKEFNANGDTQYALAANPEQSISLTDCQKIRDFGILISFAQHRCLGELVSIWGAGATVSWISGDAGFGSSGKGIFCSYAGTYRGRYYGVKAGASAVFGAKGGLYAGWNGLCFVPAVQVGLDIDVSASTMYIEEDK